MSSFTSPLIVSPMGDGKRWKLVRSFSYHEGSKRSRRVIKVPAGFVTDFASVPNPFRGVIPQWGRYGKAAVLHDWVYQTHSMTRLEGDHLFEEAMVVLGVPPWQVFVLYWSVRIFGFLVWKKTKGVVP